MRMKEKTKNRIQGSVSVLLVIILLPMMTFSAVIVDISRVNMARQMMSSAGDLTMNTALANYDTILKDVYGLFAMSQAEGMNNEQLGTELNKYFAKTLSSYGVVSKENADDYVADLIGDFRDIINNGNVDTNNFLELSNINLTATKVEDSSLANASVLRKQIVEYMKFRAPMGVGLSFLDSLTAFKKMDAQNEVVEAQVKAQESTQDVTKACQTLINLIREYDKRVVEINGSLNGLKNSADATTIPLEDYDTHVSKYLSAWGENYDHINKLNLVFLANAPSDYGVYLKDLDYINQEYYIDEDGTMYSGSNTGISVNVTLAEDAANAKTQIEAQIKNLNDNYKSYASKYTKSMLPSNLLIYTDNIDAATISNDKPKEESTINSFINFEKFLLDQSENGSLTYSQVKTVLEQIAILEKYRANYETLIDKEISDAEAEESSAQEELDSLMSDSDESEEAVDDSVSNINEENTSTNTDAEKISAAETALEKAQQNVDDLNDDKEETLDAVSSCLASESDFYKLAMAYQADAFYYGYYIVAARNTVGSEAQKIQIHFSQLLANLEELRTKLNDIDVQIGVVKQAIETYNKNLDAWETSNNTYTTANGGDSFSDQTAGDIKKARTEYDADLYDTLDTFVIAMWNEFDDLYSKLTESTNFTYGSKRIDQITTADDLISAVSGISFSDVVTVAEATQKLSTLYKGESVEYEPHTMDYTDPKQLCFLSPQILQIQALKYINNAYPPEIVITCGNCGKCENCKQKQKNDNTKAEYETTKDKLTDKNHEIEVDESNKDESEDVSDVSEKVNSDFGYTYKTNKIKGNLPSSIVKSEEPVEEEEFQISIDGEGDDGRLNASGSLSQQTDNSGSFLSKLGSIATTAVENLYILNYIFENFSYNTIVQEQIHKDVPLKTTSLLGQMSEAVVHFGVADNITNAKKSTNTLSNFSISEKNNHLYGAEIEYILFGNADPAKNVTSVNATIYAIRFGFNCIFAFTDSEIRNSTMAAGLAVQTATFGVVPYQIVQIVLQLALAAAESAIDLAAMNHGLSVAIIKTKDTWSLSMSGASNALKDAGNAAAQMLTDKITDGATKAIASVTSGLNDLVDAGADQLETAITGVSNSLQNSAQGVLEDVADKVLTSVMSAIEEGLNELPYVSNGKEDNLDKKVTAADIQAKADELFKGVRNKLDTVIKDACGDNQMALALSGDLKRFAEKVIDGMETEVSNVIKNAGELDIVEVISGELNNLKLTLVEKGNKFFEDIAFSLESQAKSAVKATKEKIQSYITQCGDDLTKEAADIIKNEVSSLTNSFVDTTLKVNPSSSSATSVKSSPVSMFKFGYKDYLMLITYISICCGDSVLLRTSDVIQMNLQKSGTDFPHKANKEDGTGSFLMSNAYTYISVTATAELDMFFMNFKIFADQVDDESAPEEVSEKTDGTNITYKGLLGY